ncbi:hypothetical protein I542_2403 [Mycobacteroides abscessus 1948]|uniref:Uncharacterized protein n=1 Tax=Mycobacteroides abscessus 1948 TaxID=1299323 RepID=A0A829QIR1_9MYCO|nr:hypothetical protein I542_2403 [Mycobacteroides abscessus 1948]
MRRQAIVTMKERGRRDLAAPLGVVLARGVDQLLRWNLIERPVTLVPAPTRWTAARGAAATRSPPSLPLPPGCRECTSHPCCA